MNVFGAAELYVQRKIAKMASCMLYVFNHSFKKENGLKATGYFLVIENKRIRCRVSKSCSNPVSK